MYKIGWRSYKGTWSYHLCKTVAELLAQVEDKLIISDKITIIRKGAENEQQNQN